MPDEQKVFEFHTAPGHDYPPPLPAAKVIPEWYKSMPVDIPNAVDGITDTLKRCPPFVDAMTCGYVIPLICDVHFSVSPQGEIEVQQLYPIVMGHKPAQYPGAPFASRTVVKFGHPWVIKTPPGYSTLFLPVLNHFALPFQLFAGMVDTDTFYRPVYFPSVCMLEPGQKLTLPKGTPIVQAIPIKRESWRHEFKQLDFGETDKLLAQQNANPHFYKDDFWNRKEYN